MVISYPKCMVAPLKERDLVEHLFWENMKEIIWKNTQFYIQRQWNQQRTCCGKFTINVSGLLSHFNNCLAQNFFWTFGNKTSTKPAGAITYLTGSCVAHENVDLIIVTNMRTVFLEKTWLFMFSKQHYNKITIIGQEGKKWQFLANSILSLKWHFFQITEKRKQSLKGKLKTLDW